MEKQNELNDFLKILDENRKNLTKQQYRTIKGQAMHGDVADANRGMQKVLKRKGIGE